MDVLGKDLYRRCMVMIRCELVTFGAYVNPAFLMLLNHLNLPVRLNILNICHPASLKLPVPPKKDPAAIRTNEIREPPKFDGLQLKRPGFHGSMPRPT